MLHITPLDAVEHVVPQEFTDSTKHEYAAAVRPVTVPGDEGTAKPPVPTGELPQVPPLAAQK